VDLLRAQGASRCAFEIPEHALPFQDGSVGAVQANAGLSRAAFTAAVETAGLEMLALQVAGVTAFFAATRRSTDQ
jgi:hypothetical protein